MKGSGPVALRSLELGGVGKSEGNSFGSDTAPNGEGTRTSHPVSGTMNASRSAADSACRARCKATVGATCTRLSISLCVVPVQIDGLASRSRDVPDCPKPGILFKDITTLLKDGTTQRLIERRVQVAPTVALH